MEDILVPIGVVGMLFIGLPWLILHYSTQWKRAGTISREDEDLLDELYELGRRLDDRMNTIERIIAADNPEWGRQHLTAEQQLPSDRLTQSEEEATPIRRS
ncbi:envelope stress response membrane protein PspB [Parasphingopyxis marina]|uniref:Envelope stress response membrane protein PspB n=1 Tax=Parasphingopyxis marina TaxID=2761622 RepID=A0A842HZ92_9SPHN|nr:envelope stress response membrane protein PspB [Parasphingopyxis marina]MBC2777681.1 envelope stress response membrane protein PspB [Parasphingopyxis marina]